MVSSRPTEKSGYRCIPFWKVFEVNKRHTKAKVNGPHRPPFTTVLACGYSITYVENYMYYYWEAIPWYVLLEVVIKGRKAPHSRFGLIVVDTVKSQKFLFNMSTRSDCLEAFWSQHYFSRWSIEASIH